MNDLTDSIEKAKNFIFSKMDSNGLWKDFESRSHGESIDWVSSYVGLSLLESGIPSFELKLTAKTVAERQNKEYGGWGWNEKIFPDADSTAFSILFLSHLGYEKEIKRGYLFY